MSSTINSPLWPQKLTVCGISELPQFTEAGVSHILSILDPEIETPEALGLYSKPLRRELRFHDVVGEFDGYHAPQDDHLEDILAFGEYLRKERDGAAHLLVHCHMGISRSTAAMAILLTQLRPGAEREAFDTLFRIRPRAWPNTRMVAIADRLLSLKGRLVEALQAHHKRIYEHHPDIADLVVGVGRGHELPQARSK